MSFSKSYSLLFNCQSYSHLNILLSPGQTSQQLFIHFSTPYRELKLFLGPSDTVAISVFKE